MVITLSYKQTRNGCQQIPTKMHLFFTQKHFRRFCRIYAYFHINVAIAKFGRHLILYYKLLASRRWKNKMRNKSEEKVNTKCNFHRRKYSLLSFLIKEV